MVEGLHISARQYFLPAATVWGVRDIGELSLLGVYVWRDMSQIEGLLGTLNLPSLLFLRTTHFIQLLPLPIHSDWIRSITSRSSLIRTRWWGLFRESNKPSGCHCQTLYVSLWTLMLYFSFLTWTWLKFFSSLCSASQADQADASCTCHSRHHDGRRNLEVLYWSSLPSKPTTAPS